MGASCGLLEVTGCVTALLGVGALLPPAVTGTLAPLPTALVAVGVSVFAVAGDYCVAEAGCLLGVAVLFVVLVGLMTVVG